MIDGIEIIDGHMHIFTSKFTERVKARVKEKGPEYEKAFGTWQEGFRRKYNTGFSEENDDPLEKIAADWCAELDRCGVDKALFIGLYPEEDELTDFIAAGKGRFTGFCTVDPLAPRAPELLRKRVKEEGYAGLKLYPPTQCFLPSDRAVYPLYEEAEALSIPIMFHLGITLSYDTDLRYADPLELHPVLRDFPEVNIIVPHFGSGYFRELLFLAYHVNNLYVDTSGTNVWVKYLPYQLELSEVFVRALDIFGPERIIFGTDSRMLTRGYREGVLKDQLEILRQSGLKREELSLIMAGNISRLTGI